MKKAWVYAAASILLGTATMIVPLILFKPAYYDFIISSRGENLLHGSPEFLQTLGEGEYSTKTYEGEETFDRALALEKALTHSSLSSIALIITPGVLFAACVLLILKKRMTKRSISGIAHANG